MIFQTLLNQPGGYTEGFPPLLATFGWTVFTPWAKTWNISISKIERKSTCWFWDLEVSLDFPDTLKSTGELYWGVSTIYSHFWLNYFYAVGKNLKNQDLKNSIFEEIRAGEHNIVSTLLKIAIKLMPQ